MITLFKIPPQKNNSCALSTVLALGTLSQWATTREIRQEWLNDITQQADIAYTKVLSASPAAGQGLSVTEAITIAKDIFSDQSISAPKNAPMSETDKAQLSRHIQYLVEYNSLTSDAEQFFNRLKLNCDSNTAIEILFSSKKNNQKIKELNDEFQRQLEEQQPAITERPIPTITLDRQEINFNFREREDLSNLSSYVEALDIDPEGLIHYLDRYGINFYEHLGVMGNNSAARTKYFTDLITNVGQRAGQALPSSPSQSAVVDPMERLTQTLLARFPANFMVLGNGHYCGIHVFADRTFALFNSETGEFSATDSSHDLCETLCRIVSENFSMRAINYALAQQQSQTATYPALFARSGGLPQEPADQEKGHHQSQRPK